MGDRVDNAEVAVLYEETGGNPLYLEQLARSFDRAGGPASAADAALGGIGIPSAVAASLSEELGVLSDQARLVLDGAAVAGDPFEPDLAADAAETSEAVAEGVDELLQLDLIRQTDVPRRFRFRHPLVRRVVYETTRGGWRLGAHERCAKALAARGATAAARAHHVERSARQGDLTAVAVLREAGEAAARLAPASAAHWLGAALRLLPETAPSEERVALLLARAGSLAARVGSPTAVSISSTVSTSPCEMHRNGVSVPRPRAPPSSTCSAFRRRPMGTLRAHLPISRASSADAVALMIELSADGLPAGDFDAMRVWAERAVAAARPLGDRPLLAAAAAVRAWASATAGDGESAQEHCDEATDLIDQLSDEVLARLDALANLATADLFLDRFPAGYPPRPARARDRPRDRPGRPCPARGGDARRSLWVQGKPREAGKLFDAAVEAARLAGNAQSLAWMLFNRSIAAVVAGDLDVALSTAEESVELEENGAGCSRGRPPLCSRRRSLRLVKPSEASR